MKESKDDRIMTLELQLEEAVQMLRLAAANQRTCLEIEEWLEQNHPAGDDPGSVLIDLLNSTKPIKTK